jgi:hypothetical protein
MRIPALFTIIASMAVTQAAEDMDHDAMMAAGGVASPKFNMTLMDDDTN